VGVDNQQLPTVTMKAIIQAVSTESNGIFTTKSRPTKRGCVLINHRLLTGESPVLVRVRPPDSRPFGDAVG